jgi:hypothetical protein
MPGEPVETFLGVTGVGIGVLIVYAAVKNVSPIAVLKETVQKGTLADISKLPKLVEGDKSATDLNQTLPPGDPGIPKSAGKPPKCAKGFTARYDTVAKKWSCIGDVPVPGGDPNNKPGTPVSNSGGGVVEV